MKCYLYLFDTSHNSRTHETHEHPPQTPFALEPLRTKMDSGQFFFLFCETKFESAEFSEVFSEDKCSCSWTYVSNLAINFSVFSLSSVKCPKLYNLKVHFSSVFSDSNYLFKTFSIAFKHVTSLNVQTYVNFLWCYRLRCCLICRWFFIQLFLPPKYFTREIMKLWRYRHRAPTGRIVSGKRPRLDGPRHSTPAKWS